MVDSVVSYRYFVTDLLTNQVVAELPLTDVSYSKALKDAGEMSAKVSIGPSTSPLSLYANTMPGKSGLYVMRNGECVWGGIIWSRDYDIIGKTLSINANEFTSYLHHRKIWKTWNLQHDGTLVYLDIENVDNLINNLEATLSTGTNLVTLTSGSTTNMKVGQIVAKISGTGAFGSVGIVYVKSITNSTQFRVGLADDTAQNHATAGAIKFKVFTAIQYVIELNPDTNDRVTLPEGTAVEIVFVDLKGYPYSGHYRVNKDFYNATKITVDSKPLQSTYPAILNGTQIYSPLPAGYKVVEISSREVKNGSSEVVIETSSPHELAVGDVIDINGLDGQFDSQNYATTYATRSESYKLQAVSDSNVINHRKGTVSTSEDTDTIKNINSSGIKIGAVFEQDGDSSYPGIMPSIFLDPPTTVVSFTTSSEALGTVTTGSDQINGLTTTSGFKKGDTLNIVSGPLKKCKIVEIVPTENKIYVDKKATGTGLVRLAANNTNGAIVMSRTATRSGDLYGTFTNKENGFSHTQISTQAIGTKQVLGKYEFTFTVADDSGNDDVKTGKKKSWKDELKVGNLIIINGVNKGIPDMTSEADDFFGNTYSEKTKYKKVKRIDVKNRKITFEEQWPTTTLSASWRKTVDINGNPDAYIYPTADSAGNGQFSIVDVTNTPIAGKKSDTAYCLNGKKEIPVIKVLSKTKFVVDPGCNNSPYDESAPQTVAKIIWKREYQANIHTHTDTYDQVRYLLGNVFEDFIYLDYVNPFLGNLEKYQARTAKYDPATDLATITTGFIKSVYSKEIKIDTDDELVAEIGLSTPYSQFVLYSENNTSNDKYEEVIVSGNDLSINGFFKIKSISSDKTKITYALPEQTDKSSRIRAISYPAINDSKIVFGKHNLVDGSNITITGLTNQNYDGSFAIRDILDEVSFTYKPKFESIVVEKVAIGKQRTSDNKYPVTLYLSRKPYTDKYAYIAGQTKITISNMGSPYDGTYTISSMDLEPPEDSTDKKNFTPSITYLVASASYHPIKDADSNSRKYGDIYTVSKASYVSTNLRKNLITNPNFDTNTTDWVSPYALTLARVTTQSYLGSASLRLTNSTGAQYATATNRPSGTRLAVTAGQKYTFSYYIKNGTSTSNWFASIKGFAASSGGTAINITDGTATATSTSIWTRRSVTATIPASGVNYIEGWVVNSANDVAGAIVYVDAVLLELSSNLNSYVDGEVSTGNGVVTYKTPTAHEFVAGDTVAISNVGDIFTQKIGSTNAYSEIMVAITTVPNNTSFTTNNQGLYGVNYNYDLSLGKSSVSEISPSGATVRYYDPSPSKTNALPPMVKIDDLPDVTSPIKNSITVIDRAFNKDDRMVYLKLGSNPGFYKGGTVVVDKVDGKGENVFDGTFIIDDIKKITDGNWRLSYKSNNRSLKEDFGDFKDLTPKNKSKVRNLQAYEGNSGGTVTQETWVYVGSYGSYPGSSDIGIEFSTQAYSGHYMRSDTYFGHDLKTVGEALATYADKFITRPGSPKSIRNIYGFDYRINCVYDYDTESFRRIFTFIPVHYPNEPLHGETSPVSRFGADKVVFEYPGNIQNVSLKESSENASTRFWMVGSDGGTGTANATKSFVGVASKDLLNKNWPILELENSDDKLDFLVDISDRAYRYLSETQPPTGEFTVTVNGSLDPVVNTYQPSDWCSIIVNDPFVKERLLSDLEPRETVIVRKITAYTVDVPNNPSFPEQVSLTLIPEWDVDKRGQ